MIHAENGRLTVCGENKEIFMEVGAILYKLSEDTSEAVGEFVDPVELAKHCVVAFLEEIEEELNKTEAENEPLS